MSHKSSDFLFEKAKAEIELKIQNLIQNLNSPEWFLDCIDEKNFKRVLLRPCAPATEISISDKCRETIESYNQTDLGRFTCHILKETSGGLTKRVKAEAIELNRIVDSIMNTDNSLSKTLKRMNVGMYIVEYACDNHIILSQNFTEAVKVQKAKEQGWRYRFLRFIGEL